MAAPPPGPRCHRSQSLFQHRGTCRVTLQRGTLPVSNYEGHASPRQLLVKSAAGPPGAFDEDTKGKARQGLFNNISTAYDDLNEQLSLGQHKVWKKMAVQWSRAAPGGRALDICCGSGDLAFMLARAVGPSGAVMGLDFAQNMLDYAQQRQYKGPATARAGSCGVEWVLGDALSLPFTDHEFDAVTMGYGLRNVANVPQALREIHRVLKHDAWAAILDFNHSENAATDAVQGFLLEQIVVPVAKERGLTSEYAYLRPSIQAFPVGPEQERLAVEAGFDRATHYEIGFGLMGCLVLQKGM